MPSTMSTDPSLSAPSGSLPVSTMESFRPRLSAMAAATSTSMPTILLPDMPASGARPVFTPTRKTPASLMVGD